MTKLERILAIIPPPKDGIFFGGDSSWIEIQKNYGNLLPKDLDKYGRAYGSGEFRGGRYITIFNPHDPAYDSNINIICNIYKDLREESPAYYPYACYPERNGLFPIAWGDDVLAYILLTEEPEKYQIIYQNPSRDYVEYPDLTFLDFLYDFLSHKISEEFFNTEIVFHPTPLVFRKGNLYGAF